MRSTLSDPVELQPYSYDRFRQCVWDCSKNMISLAEIVNAAGNALVRFIAPILDPTVPAETHFMEALKRVQSHSKQLAEVTRRLLSRWRSESEEAADRERWTPYDESAWARFEVDIVQQIQPIIRLIATDLQSLEVPTDSEALKPEIPKIHMLRDKALEYLTKYDAHLNASSR